MAGQEGVQEKNIVASTDVLSTLKTARSLLQPIRAPMDGLRLRSAFRT